MKDLEVTKVVMGNKIISGVDLRDLHGRLESNRHFTDFANYFLVDFIEGEDFIKIKDVQHLGLHTLCDRQKSANKITYIISLEIAKHICLMSRSELGKRYRKHLISLEANFEAEVANRVQQLEELHRLQQVQLAEANARLAQIEAEKAKRSPYTCSLKGPTVEDLVEILDYNIAKCSDVIAGCECNIESYKYAKEVLLSTFDIYKVANMVNKIKGKRVITLA